MPTYEAHIDIPWLGQQSELERFVEGMREQAYLKLKVQIEADSKAEAAHMLAESTEDYADRFGQFDYGWWLSKLITIRSKTQKEAF